MGQGTSTSGTQCESGPSKGFRAAVSDHEATPREECALGHELMDMSVVRLRQFSNTPGALEG